MLRENTPDCDAINNSRSFIVNELNNCLPEQERASTVNKFTLKKGEYTKPMKLAKKKRAKKLANVLSMNITI